MKNLEREAFKINLFESCCQQNSNADKFFKVIPCQFYIPKRYMAICRYKQDAKRDAKDKS